MKVIKKSILLIFIVLFIVSILLAVGNTLQTLMIEKLINSAMALEQNEIIKNVCIIGGIIISVLICEYVRKRLFALSEKKITHILRKNLTKCYLGLSFRSYREHPTQTYISLINNDIKTVVEDYFLLGVDIFFLCFSIIVYTAALIWIYPVLALIVVSANALPLLIPIIFKKKLAKQKKDAYSEIGRYNVRLSQIIVGFPTIRFNQIRRLMHNHHNNASLKSVEKKYAYEKTVIIADILIGAFSFLCLFALLAAGAYFLAGDTITVGGLFAAILLSELMVTPTINLSSNLNTFFATRAVKDGLHNSFAVNSSQDDLKKISIDDISSIEFRNVSFSYIDEETKQSKKILDGINLTINKNEKCLVTGDNGSGKSTIVKLLLGQFDDYSGKILINGIDYSEINAESIYSLIGYAEQQPMIFYDTVLNNITLYKEYDGAKLQKAISIFGIDNNEKLQLEQAINKDNELSDGERQKIALARLYLQGKKTIILDEAMTSLDNSSYDRVIANWLNQADITLIHIDHSASYRKSNLYNKTVKISDGKLY